MRRTNTRGKPAQSRTSIAKARFLESYRVHGVVGTAATDAGVVRQTIYVWQEHDEDFATAMNLAREEALDVLEHEMYRRAVVGVKQDKPIFYRGEVVGTYQVTEYSDRMLELALKAGRPEKYRERHDVNVTTQPQAVAYDIADVGLL